MLIHGLSNSNTMTKKTGGVDFVDDPSVNEERCSGDEELVSVASPDFPIAEQKSNGQQHTPVVRKDMRQHVVTGQQQITSSSQSATLSK